MNGDTFYSGQLNLDCGESTIFVVEEEVTSDVGYIHGRDGKVQYFVEKDSGACGKKLVSLGIYKLYRDEIELPNKLPISMEYDILPKMELSYKILKTKKFDIGTPERLQTFKDWVC
jgi:NDP-sugar pyrophosphorylase family protein